MKAEKPESSAKARQRQRALSSGEIEGGAGSSRPRRSPAPSERKAAVPPLGNAELVQLHIRVIALENLVIALLAESPDRRLEIAREMASYISPRPGFTAHRLTTRAAAQMLHLVERAGLFRVGGTPS